MLESSLRPFCRPDGEKKAYVRLMADYDALDVANKVSWNVRFYDVYAGNVVVFVFWSIYTYQRLLFSLCMCASRNFDLRGFFLYCKICVEVKICRG